ncbi:carbohydrate ABC transporter permease [Extibacter muris]|uniref:carbohydrate ABC transporter permease n=1 Tax=Extibacter muris TaxID=1796622 RepID=UPI001D095A2C|nr:sugar ABC transporter permease [Extibacter muris]MCB6203046.1 sugar ABC transporter permease [Extibacter muris]MCQ4664269.1 sugar ABC transporter permease [Extibacter muris]MCQ4695184.1 sugar ABC transporter permease [Extibacter muris]
MRKKNQKTVGLYLFPALFIVIIVLYLPIFINLYESFFSWGAMSTKHEFVGFANYIKMFKDEVFYVALKNNMIFMVTSVIFQIGISLIIANVLECKFMRRSQNFFRSIYFVPSLLMVTVVGIAFKMIVSPSIGILNPLLELAGADASKMDLLGNAGSATYAIAAMSQWQYIGYTVILFIVAIQNIPGELYEAADIDGANAVKKFFYITVPEIKDTILINTIITVTGSIRAYDEVFVTTNGGPGYATETLATYLYKAGFRNDQMGYASALAFFIFIVTFIIGLAQMKGYRLDDQQ